MNSSPAPAPWRWPNFSPAELRCKGTGLLRYDQRFLDALQALRTALRQPLTVTSGCRAESHNAKVGGHPRSLHIGDTRPEGALAVDIACPDGALRGSLFSLAWQHGFSIGWNAKRGFLHLDRRDLVGLPQTSFDY